MKDWVKRPETGEWQYHGREAAMRAELKIKTRQWVMARLDPKLWGQRQQVDVISQFENLSVEERERRALALIGRLKELAAPVIDQPIVYRRDPPEDDGAPASG
jgi:hypothetical protein